MVRTRAHAFLYFFLSVAAVLAVLLILNRLPAFLQKDLLRTFASVEEVRSKLNIREVAVPSYFPQGIQWPPSAILAQAKPYPAVLLIFNAVKTGDTALVISQASSGAFGADAHIPLARIARTVPYELKARKALLEVGACESGEPCSRLSWNENDKRITLTMKAPPFELIRIAESMLH